MSAERLAWMRARAEVEVVPNEVECWACHETHGHMYRYLARFPDYDNHEPAYPSQWYHECGHAADPQGTPADA